MKRLVFSIICALSLNTWSAKAEAATYTYVGSWILGNGPLFSTNPSVYSGQSAAALLFGGSPSDYAISTVDADPADINFETYLDGYGNTTYLINPAPENFSESANGGGYNSGPSFSAYVLDHTCENRYSNLASACSGDGTQYVNFAFRQDVPEPTSASLLGIGLLGAAALRRRKPG